jgi:hypothetical protein
MMEGRPPVIEFHLNLGDAVILPDGERWFITQDDTSHLYWLSDKPDPAKSRKKMPVLPGGES